MTVASIFLSALTSVSAFCQTGGVGLYLDQSPSDGGTITPGTGIHRFVPNSQIEISAVPQEGFRFAYWLGDVQDPTASTTQVRLDDSKAVVAVYEPINPINSNDDKKRKKGGAYGGGGTSGLMPSQADFFTVGFAAPGGSSQGSQNITYQVIATEPVPEPITIVFMGLGGLTLTRRFRRKNVLYATMRPNP